MATKQLPIPTLFLNKQQARQFLLEQQYLSPPRQLQGKEGILEIFSRLGCIQFDTINVVGRNADLALQARIDSYRPDLLEDLLYKDRDLIDGWDKVASIHQTTDWPYFDRIRKERVKHRYQRSPEVAEFVPEILEAARENGPISSIDFKNYPKTDWYWSSTSLPRATMETLFTEGRLGISSRVNTRRNFDLIERLVPEDILNQDDPNVTDEAYQEWHILRRIGSMGIASPSGGEYWQGMYKLGSIQDRRLVIDRLIEMGDVTVIGIEGLDGQVLLIRTIDFSNRKLTPGSSSLKPKAAFIAPLDNLIWNRKLIGELFDFKYVWEVYKPNAQREYGYYVLPVLYGDRFIARVDMKFDRKTKTLNVHNWWWESGVKRDPEISEAVNDCFSKFSNYLEAENIQISPDARSRTFLRKVIP